MKLNLRFLYLLPLLALLFTDRALVELVFGNAEEQPIVILYVYGLAGCAVLMVLRYYRSVEPLMRWWFWLVMACIGGLCLESYGIWGSWAKYPHVFSKLTALLPLFGLYAYYRRYPDFSYRQLVLVVFPGLLLSLVLFHRDALTLSSFLTSERGFSVTSAYMLLPVALLCLNWYLTRGRAVSGLSFLLAMALIVFLQHRTVWVCSSIALALNLMLMALRVPEARHIGRRLTLLGGTGALLALGGGLAVVLDNPDVARKFVGNLEDLQHPTTQGTGTFRVHQYEAYLPLVKERPLAGWRLEGFEMPAQLYDNLGDQVWTNLTGHHFHSFYLDRLFYFGWLGLLLAVLVPVVVLLKTLLRTLLLGATLSPELAAMLSFVSTLFVFGISYDWPGYTYGMLGVVLAAVSRQAAPASTPALPPPRFHAPYHDSVAMPA